MLSASVALAAAFCTLYGCRPAAAYYILRGSASNYMLPPADEADFYPELPIRLARRSLVDYAAQPPAADEPPSELMLLDAANFVPSLTPIDRAEENQNQDWDEDEGRDDDDSTPAAYLLVPQRAIDAQRAKRAVVDAQTDALAGVLDEALEERRQRLDDAQREAELVDELEYANRAEQLRLALLNRRPERPVAALVVEDNAADDDDNDAPPSLERILTVTRPKRVADGAEPAAVRLPVDPSAVDGYDGAAAVAAALFGDAHSDTVADRMEDERNADLPFVIIP